MGGATGPVGAQNLFTNGVDPEEGERVMTAGEGREKYEPDVKVGGVYLYLFHGRKSPEEQLEDWGDRGPVLGPFPFVHTTYCADIKCGYEGEELQIVGELVYYDGVYYGDWSVISAITFETNREMKTQHEEFDPLKAKLPAPVEEAKVE